MGIIGKQAELIERYGDAQRRVKRVVRRVQGT